MLGHDVPFSYCREPGREVPCGRVMDCWREVFDVEGWVQSHFTAAQIAEITAPRQDKVATLVELIEQARRRAKR
jgi:SH3-like domain-containing protein